jgi:uncharacterized membrane protein YhaH (DUF805 family)
LSYRDGVGDNAQLLLRTIKGTADFSGRSRRTEVIYYWIAAALAGVIVGFPLTSALSFGEAIKVNEALRLVFLVPMFALFARRLHDQDRTGWWALLLPISIALSIPDLLAWASADPQIIMAERGPWWLALIGVLIGLAILVLFLLPGTEGPNRFGNDPRLTD